MNTSVMNSQAIPMMRKGLDKLKQEQYVRSGRTKPIWPQQSVSGKAWHFRWVVPVLGLIFFVAYNSTVDSMLGIQPTRHQDGDMVQNKQTSVSTAEKLDTGGEVVHSKGTTPQRQITLAPPISGSNILSQGKWRGVLENVALHKYVELQYA